MQKSYNFLRFTWDIFQAQRDQPGGEEGEQVQGGVHLHRLDRRPGQVSAQGKQNQIVEHTVFGEI